MIEVLIRKSLRTARLCSAALALLFFGSLSLHAQTAVGIVSRMTGTARIARAGANLDVSNGTAVFPWDKLTAEAQSSLTIVLNKGGSIGLEGPLQFVVDVSDSLAPMGSAPEELLRKISGQNGMSTFRASAMGLRAERPRLAFDSLGAFSTRLHPRRERQRVGNVLKVIGTAHVTKSASIILVHQGTQIDAGDALTTDTDALVILAMNDGGAIELAKRSQLMAGTLENTPGGAGSPFRLMAGSACLRLSRGFLDAWPGFSVSTLNADVKGTAGQIAIRTSDHSATYGRSTAVAVEQGTASVSNPFLPDQIIEVQTGYESAVRGTQAPSSAKPITSTEPCRH